MADEAEQDDKAQQRPPRGKGDTDPELRSVAEAEDDGMPLLKLGAVLAIVLAVALGWAVLSTRPSGARLDSKARIANKLKRLRKQLSERKFEQVFAAAAALIDEEGELAEADEIVALAHEGQMQSAFMALDPIKARSLMPDGWNRYFPELPWILALNGEASQAAELCDESVDATQRARLAAWGEKLELCQRALAELPSEQRRALSWELRAYLPDLEAKAGDVSSPGPLEGWEAAAHAEEALAQSLTSVAAIAFDNALRSSDDETLRLTCLLGLARVALARGDVEDAGEKVSDAYLLARQPLDRARCLGWASLVTLASGEEIKLMSQQLGERPVLEEAQGYAPGTPLVIAAARNAAIVAAWAERHDPQAPVAPASQPWTSLGKTRDARRSGQGPFLRLERQRCAEGADGVAGQLVARGAELAAMAQVGTSRNGAALALELLERAAALRPASPAVFVGIAQSQLLLNRPTEALQAARRACFLAPAEPEAELLRGLALRAGLQQDHLALGRARLGGDDTTELTQKLADDLAPCLEALRAATAAAGDDEALSAQTRLETGRTLAWRTQLLLQAGADASDAQREALEALGPLLAGLEVEAVVGARRELLRTLRDGKPDQVAPAEAALAKAAPPRSPAQLDALLVASTLGDGGAPARAEAYTALVGDLPARALLALRHSEQLDAAARREEVQRALSLADLPAIRLAAACLRAPARDARSFRELSAVIEQAPEWQHTVLGIMYWSPERLHPFSLEHFADGEAEDPDELLARAAFLRSSPVFGEHLDELGDEERATLGLEHDRVSTQGAVLSHRALQRRPGSIYGHLLRAMLHSSMALGSPVESRGDPRTTTDVAFDLACARAAGPWSSGTYLYHLHWQPDLVPSTVEELLAEGYTNIEALLNNTYSDVAGKILQPAAGLVNELTPGGDPSQSVKLAKFLAESDSLPSLALALGLELADRPQPDPGWIDVVSGARSIGGQDLLGERPQIRLQAEARLELALAKTQGSAALVGEAGIKAHQALLDGQAPGSLLPLRRRQLRALEVRPAIPTSIRYSEILVAHGLPAHQDLWSAWHSLYRPEAALEWLAEAALAAERLTPGEPFALAEPWGRPQAWIRSLQEARPQERAVSWLLAAGSWDEALASAERAAAFARGEPSAEVLRRQIATTLRPHALEQEGPAREAQLKALYRLVLRAIPLTADGASLRTLGKQLRADLKAS